MNQRFLGCLGAFFIALAVSSQLSIGAVVTYTLGDTSFYTNWSSGGGTFSNAGGAELGMWANTGAKQVVAWRTFRTLGNNTGLARDLQIGDVFTIQVWANNSNAGGQIGLSLNDGGSTGSWNNRYSGSRLYIQEDGTAGSWYVNNSAGNTTLDYNVSGTSRNYQFKVYITSQTTADIDLIVDGATTKRVYNVTMNGSAGENIDSWSVYRSDGSSDIFWKQTTTVQDTGTVNLGYYLTSGTYNPGIIDDGLNADSTSTVRVNSVNIGGDSGTAVILNDTSTYTGLTTINAAATARAQNNSAFGTTDGGVTVTSGGVIEISGTTAIGAEALTLNGTGISSGGALKNTANNNSWAGNITLGSASSIVSDSGILTLSGTVTHGGNRLTVLGNSGVTISGAMSGTGNSDILKQGSGALTLSGDNSGLNPSGVTSVYIDQGTVYLNNNNAGGAKGIELGSGVSGAGSAALYAIGGRSIANAITIQSENTTTLTIGSDSTADDNTFTGNVTIEKTANFNAESGRTVTFTNGVLSGAGGVTKMGTGTLSLLGANTFSGNVIISAGTLSITNANSLGRGDFNFGNGNTLTTLLVNSNTTITNRFRVYNAASNAVINVVAGATNTISGQLTQDGSDAKTKFGKDGDGTLILNNSTSDFKGQLQVGRGTVILGHNNALGSNISVENRGVDLGLNVGDVSTGTDATLLASNGVTVGQSIYVAAPSGIAARKIGISGSGTTTFNNEIYMDGNLIIDSVASGNTVNVAGKITQNQTNGTTVGIIKNSAGTVVLSGANDYKGTTTVNAGTLKLERLSGGVGAASITGSTIAVNSGGTLLLGQANQIASSTDIMMSGGVLATGGNADVVGRLTVTANSTIVGLNTSSTSSANSFLFSDIDLGAYTTANLGTASGLTLYSSGSPGSYEKYQLGQTINFSSKNNWTDTTSLNNFASKISFDNSEIMAQINFTSGTGITTLSVVAVPEPKVYVAAGALALLIGFAEVRRRKRAKRAV